MIQGANIPGTYPTSRISMLSELAKRLRMTPLRAGFSLPEVAIAVGIAALGLITLLGIIPSGLDSIRIAGQTTAEARIVSQVLGEIQLSDWGSVNRGSGTWSNLQTTAARRWYFDDQANPLSEAAATNSMDNRLAYVVRVQFLGASRLTGASEDAADMQKVQVDIGVATEATYGFTNPRGYRVFPAVLTSQFSRS